MTTIDIARALDFDPFQGGFGELGDREISDKIVTTKKDHPECSCCGEPIKAGAKNRVKIEVYDREMHTHRWCQSCTEAMTADPRSTCPDIWADSAERARAELADLLGRGADDGDFCPSVTIDGVPVQPPP